VRSAQCSTTSRFGVLLWLMRAGPIEFRTGWFLESVISATLIVLVVRTAGGSSLACRRVLCATIYVWGRVFNFKPVPASFVALMGAIVPAYVASAELIKRWFYPKAGTLMLPAPIRGEAAQAVEPLGETRPRKLARPILVSFLFTFMAARVLVLLIVARRIPDVYLHLGGTHIHHLNYGILLLSGVGAYLLLGHPGARGMYRSAITYGIGLALTFDEFGLWLHLGGSYWQRASFDAVVVIAGLLGLAIVAPRLRQFRPHHYITAAALAVVVIVFGVLLVDSLKYADRLLLRIQITEESRPPLP
jgi:hypothetical protein